MAGAAAHETAADDWPFRAEPGQTPAMERAGYLTAIEREGRALLAAVDRAPDARVEHCPDWDNTGLADHMRSVWGFMATQVAAASPDRPTRPDPDDTSTTVEALDALLAHPAVAGAMVVIGQDDADWPGWGEWAGKPVLTCIGGATRAASVLAGLQALPDTVRADEFVLVHDAARPNLSLADLGRLRQSA